MDLPDRIVLDAYAARSCPVKTYNAFDPSVTQPAVPDDESLRESFQGGRAYRELVLGRLVERYGDYVTYDPPWSPATALLWLAPLLLLGFGAWVARGSFKRRESDRSTRQ